MNTVKKSGSFIKFEKYSLFTEIFVCAAITLASYTFFHDNRVIVYGIENPERINAAIRYIAFAVLVLTWLSVCISCGLRGRFGFAIFTALFWALPPLIFYLLSHVPLDTVANETLILLINIAMFVSEIITFSTSVLSDSAANGFSAGFYTNIIFFFIYIITFFGAYFAGEHLKKRKTNTMNRKGRD